MNHQVQFGIIRSCRCCLGEAKEPSKGISYPVGDLCKRFTKLTWHSASLLDSYPICPRVGTNDPCDLLHTFLKQVTNVFKHVLSSNFFSSFIIKQSPYAARAGNEEPVTLQAGVEDKDGQDVLTELHKQIVQEKSRRLELLQAEQVVTLE